MTIDNQTEEKYMQITDHQFENVQTFKYIGSTINLKKDHAWVEAKERTAGGNKAFYSTHHLLKTKTISRRTKKTIYKNIIRPEAMYASETSTSAKTTENLPNT